MWEEQLGIKVLLCQDYRFFPSNCFFPNTYNPVTNIFFHLIVLTSNGL